jgi:purine nucleosidase/non-specific riboncleoside hydrolase
MDMAPNRLILDTDGGVDDAQALLLLIANRRPPDAITSVFGNVSLEAATANILAVLAVAGVDIPVHVGTGEPLAQPRIDARHVHGEDGLGGAPRPKRVAEVAGTDAVAFLISTLSSAAHDGERVDLLMIGPLTNLALALKQAPRIATSIGRLTIMGGTLNGRGNVTPAAEFNIFADPEAAGDVLRAALDITLVPWEPCLAHALQGAEIDRLFEPVPASDYKAFARALVQHERQRHIRLGQGDCLFLIDPLAAAVVVEPAIVTRSLAACVDVALAPGVTRGMTVVDPSGRLGTPTVTLLEEARMDRLASLYAASVSFAPTPRR